jgi:hypothetical protein
VFRFCFALHEALTIHFSSVAYLSLQGNALSGTIPSDIGLLTILTVLDLSSCSFSGKIPTEVGLLDSLVSLRLGNNLLRETVPTEIGLLTNLVTLNLEATNLSGTIPSEILQLPNLDQIQYSGSLLTLDLTEAGFSCAETTVEMVLTTESWYTDVTWEITTGDGSVAASGGGDSLFSHAAHVLEKVCVPFDACAVTLFDPRYENVKITRLGRVYQIDRPFIAKVVLDICT